MFNVGRATHWAIADDLGVNPKADPETIGLAILIFKWPGHHFANVPSEVLLTGNLEGIVPATDFTYTRWSLVSDEPAYLKRCHFN